MPTPPEYWFLLPVCDDLRETQIQSVMTTFALEPDLAISEMLVVDGLLPPDWDSQFEVLHDEASAVIARNPASAKAARQLVSNACWGGSHPLWQHAVHEVGRHDAASHQEQPCLVAFGGAEDIRARD